METPSPTARKTSIRRPTARTVKRALAFTLLGALAVAAGLVAWYWPLLQQIRTVALPESLTYRQVIDRLTGEIEDHYPYLEAKKLDWTAVKTQAQAGADTAASDAEFSLSVADLIAGLRDYHAMSTSDSLGLASYGTGINLRTIGGRTYVASVVAQAPMEARVLVPGTEVLSIDGRPIAQVLTSLPERFIAVFSETTRIRRRDQHAFWGEKDSPAVVRCRAPEEPVQEVVVPRSVPFTTTGLGERVTLRMIGRIGYIHVPILTNAGQRRDDTIEKQVEDALLQVRDADAIILDIRGNPGGASWTAGSVASHFLTQTEKYGSFRCRNGAVWPCLQKARPDAFTGPLAILVDEGVGSASENALLFPLVTLRDPARTWTIGRPSAGGSGIPNFRYSYRGIYAQFPGIPFVDRQGNLDLELTGIAPNYPVTITVEDLLTGRDPDLAKALEALEAALTSLEGK